MIYEFIATITAGFGMAGIALIIRHLSKFTGHLTPKWLLPIFAGIGMLGFQLHQEYNWQDHQLNQLPEQVSVVKSIEETTWYRPWSYLKPQVVRFMAVNDAQPIQASESVLSSDVYKVNLYLLERRISTKIVPQLIDCAQSAYASIPESVSLTNDVKWHPLAKNDELIKAVCQS